VLSHIERKENRIDILSSIRSVLSPEGLLLLTVPHALRRFPLHASSDGRGSESSDASSARAQARRYFPSARPVIYRHHVENEVRPFPYYLFSRRELTAELSAAGFALEVLESDSILPERRLVRRPALAPVDKFLCWLLPSWAGYGAASHLPSWPLAIERPEHRRGSWARMRDNPMVRGKRSVNRRLSLRLSSLKTWKRCSLLLSQVRESAM
jgi:hypothetical protein